LGTPGDGTKAPHRDQVRGSDANHAIAKTAVDTASTGNGLEARVTTTAATPMPSTATPAKNTMPA
jgi:hypothetical protein